MHRVRARIARVVAAGLAIAIFMALAGSAESYADVAMLTPSKDNTLYESVNGSLSNGSGQHFFAGHTAVAEIRRGLIAFDLAGSVPAGSTVNGVTLTLNMSRVLSGLPPHNVALHRALADWGEAGSDAAGNEGGGALAQAGDATWLHRSFNTVFWGASGGDFAPGASATVAVGGLGPYTWGSTPAMVADVQAWVDDPSSNFGWILIGDETAVPSSRRFDSRENLLVSARPTLIVDFTPGGEPAGSVPDGDAVPGAPLTVATAPGGSITLDWTASCAAGDSDYAVYEGSLDDFASHAPLLCSTGGLTTESLTPSPGDRYYLVVPLSATSEGSYGRDGGGEERPPSAAACRMQQVAACP